MYFAVSTFSFLSTFYYQHNQNLVKCISSNCSPSWLIILYIITVENNLPIKIVMAVIQKAITITLLLTVKIKISLTWKDPLTTGECNCLRSRYRPVRKFFTVVCFLELLCCQGVCKFLNYLFISLLDVRHGNLNPVVAVWGEWVLMSRVLRFSNLQPSLHINLHTKQRGTGDLQRSECTTF